MSQKGAHTWDLYLYYHSCPECGKIIESREDYTYKNAEYIKSLECPRCHHLFTLKKDKPLTFGPLIGDPQPVEIDW